MSSSSQSGLVDELQRTIDNTENSLQDLLDQAQSDSSTSGGVVKQLRETVQDTGQSFGEMIQTAFESTDSNDEDFLQDLEQEAQQEGKDLKQALKERTN